MSQYLSYLKEMSSIGAELIFVTYVKNTSIGL